MLKLDFPVKIPSRELIYAVRFHCEEMRVTSLVSGWKTLGLPASLNLTFLQRKYPKPTVTQYFRKADGAYNLSSH